MKTISIMLKDLRLICRDRFGLLGLLLVPIVVIMVIAVATQSGNGTRNIVFPVVNEDEGPIATALINSFRKHLDVRIVSQADAVRMVADANQAPAALILPPELSKRYLAQKPSNVELLTDPAQWQELGAIKVAMLVADHDAASANDPLSQELLKVHENSLTSKRLSFSSLEQNIPGFSLMFVLLTLLFSVSLGLREEESWGTSTRLRVAPVSLASVLGGKLLARWIIGSAQLLLLLLFGHLVYGLALGHSPFAMVVVAMVAVASMTCFAAVVAAFVRTREQAVPVGLAVAFILASLGGLLWPLYNLPRSIQQVARVLITTWSMFGIQDVMLRDRSLIGISNDLLVLVAYGFASFLLATWMFRYGEKTREI
jgi:ABC-2 type transport system permease protein